jgi:hypothetical protein
MQSAVSNSLVENQDYLAPYVPAARAYVHQEYPKWKYSLTGSCVVNSADEEAALGDGWFDAKPTANDTPARAQPSVQSELDALIAKAQELGIEIDKRWGVKRLRQEVAHASH